MKQEQKGRLTKEKAGSWNEWKYVEVKSFK